MQIKTENIDRYCEEITIFNEILSLDNKSIVELGCGKADLTRNIATNGVGREITAFEIDEIQHTENLKIADLANVTFKPGAAEEIEKEDDSVDVIFMFKSLHHVPINAMDTAFSEMYRILKPNGFIYVSEPIFDGEFNEILRLFHDEEKVRAAAFEAEKRAVDSGKFTLEKQVFFNSPMHFDDFSAFEKLILGVTHTDFVLSDELYNEVKTKFERHLGSDSDKGAEDDKGTDFHMPIRVDLLRAVK